MIENQKIPISVVIPTYGRERVLLEAIDQLLQQVPAAAEILVIDQTVEHEQSTDLRLGKWHSKDEIRWIRLDQPSQPAALNIGLQKATQPFVLFLDDDIRIDQEFMEAHYNAFDSEGIWGVAGQVLQPGEEEDEKCIYRLKPGLLVDVDFAFRTGRKRYVQNGMSGNLCVRRKRALQIGGFDENFTPPVSYRFDNEFCKRLCRAGGKIVFEPKARIYHLRAERGGTRTNSNHMTSMSPEHGVGDYYFALRVGLSSETLYYILRRPFREVRTKFHLCHPWWIPVKLVGEFRALILALLLLFRGPRYLHVSGLNIQYRDGKEK